MITSEARLKVRYAETDQMRVAHHSNYIVWFELARVGLFKKLDIDIADLEGRGYYIPVLEVSARYLRPARFGEEITIQATLTGRSRAKLTFGYIVKNESGDILCEGKSVHGFMNAQYKAVRPPEIYKQKVARTEESQKHAGQ